MGLFRYWLRIFISVDSFLAAREAFRGRFVRIAHFYEIPLLIFSLYPSCCSEGRTPLCLSPQGEIQRVSGGCFYHGDEHNERNEGQ